MNPVSNKEDKDNARQKSETVSDKAICTCGARGREGYMHELGCDQRPSEATVDGPRAIVAIPPCAFCEIARQNGAECPRHGRPASDAKTLSRAETPNQTVGVDSVCQPAPVREDEETGTDLRSADAPTTFGFYVTDEDRENANGLYERLMFYVKGLVITDKDRFLAESAHVFGAVRIRRERAIPTPVDLVVARNANSRLHSMAQGNDFANEHELRNAWRDVDDALDELEAWRKRGA